MTRRFANSTMAATVALALMLALGGCRTSVAVQGTLPTPLVAPIDVRMGMHFPAEFREYVHEEFIHEKGGYKVALGEQNYSFFVRLFETMFAETREVSAPPLPDGERDNLDGIIVPTIEKYGFLSPSVSGLQFFSASIQYKLSVYDPDGVPLASWSVIGYGKSPSEGFRESAALGEATMLAIRDAGARIALETSDQAEMKAWLARVASRADE